MKTVIIMSGIPGSGKDYWIKRTFERPVDKNLTLVSADRYFDRLGKFDPSLLSEAHGECLRKYCDAVLGEYASDLVIVNNTNTTTEEMAPYVALALAYGYKVKFVTIFADPEVCAKRNVHGVPLAGCRRMAERLKARVIPEFWKGIEHEVIGCDYSNDGLTHDELVIACKNIDYDLTCGQCASVFYTGSGTYLHTCKKAR